MKSLLISLIAAATGLFACACTGQASTSAPHVTVTVTAHPSHTAGSQPSSAGGAAAPAGSQVTQTTSQNGSQAGTQNGSEAAAPGCLSRYLGTKIVPSGDAGDSVYVNIDFKNLDNVTCTLYGYPGVSLGGGVPVTQIGLASLENLATPRQLVTLPPGGIAWAQLQIVQAATYLPSLCRPRAADYLDIIPPNQSVAIPTYYTTTACAKPVHLLTVDAVQFGTS